MGAACLRSRQVFNRLADLKPPSASVGAPAAPDHCINEPARSLSPVPSNQIVRSDVIVPMDLHLLLNGLAVPQPLCRSPIGLSCIARRVNAKGWKLNWRRW